MNKVKQDILDFFEGNRVILPVSVSNAIDDIFDDYIDEDHITEDNAEEAIGVTVYTRETFDTLSSDLGVYNNLNIPVNGPLIGEFTKVDILTGEADLDNSTYITVNDSNVILVDKPQYDENVINEDSHFVAIKTHIKWEESGCTKTYEILIYVPSTRGE